MLRLSRRLPAFPQNMQDLRPTALIIGAGPAGLTAAHEFLKRSDIRPVVLEKSEYMGGIARTVRYRGNRMDIGGHRFFSKSDRVMQWWMDVFPPERSVEGELSIAYHNQRRGIAGSGSGPDPSVEDRVLLIRRRKSRIYFLRRFFDYPIKLSPDTLRKLGVRRTVKIAASYLAAMIHPRRPERTFEDFLVNRFGAELYRTFFKSYTEKVWGVPCREISAEWGAQRIKGLSLLKTITHFLRNLVGATRGIEQKRTETSLIERFLYPKFGPGHLWEQVADSVRAAGGTILTGWTVDRILTEGARVTGVEAIHQSGERRRIQAGYVFSTMPIRDLVRALDPPAPAPVREISDGLIYRDFVVVGLLLDRLLVEVSDTWIYIQEPDVLVGRLQIFNNWSPYLVADRDKMWIGLEYFCNENDDLWRKSDQEMIALAVEELARIGMAAAADVRDGTVVRMPKTYPAYFGTYNRFDELRSYLDRFENLFLVGRNGMHKYNNQDHSMLTAMTAVDNILAGRTDKSNIWAVNTEMEYHEER